MLLCMSDHCSAHIKCQLFCLYVKMHYTTLVFSRKPKLLLDLETTPDIKVSGTFNDYYNLLNKRLQYLHKLLQDFKSKS